jgi:hypothetical protein
MMKDIIAGEDSQLFHLQLKILHINDYVWLHNNVDHSKEGVAVEEDVSSFRALIGKILLANKESFVQGCGEVVFDGVSHQARDCATFLLVAD